MCYANNTSDELSRYPVLLAVFDFDSVTKVFTTKRLFFL
jgi:hypothetical protein